MYYIGWLIPEQERNDLLRIFSPTFPDVYAHHITLQYDVEPDYPLPTIKRATLIGMCEAEAIEALVFERDGKVANGKSLLSILTLACPLGSRLTIRAEGMDAREAVEDLGKLIEDKFGED